MTSRLSDLSELSEDRIEIEQLKNEIKELRQLVESYYTKYNAAMKRECAYMTMLVLERIPFSLYAVQGSEDPVVVPKEFGKILIGYNRWDVWKRATEQEREDALFHVDENTFGDENSRYDFAVDLLIKTKHGAEFNYDERY